MGPGACDWRLEQANEILSLPKRYPLVITRYYTHPMISRSSKSPGHPLQQQKMKIKIDKL
jgi:hypothetical protein